MAEGKPQQPGQDHGSGRLSLERRAAARPEGENPAGNRQPPLTLDQENGNGGRRDTHSVKYGRVINVKYFSSPTTIKIPGSVRTSFSSPK